MAQIGDIFLIDATGEFAPHIECVVVEIEKDTGRPTKVKATVRDERLGRIGFLLEGQDYVAVDWYWSNN